MTEHPISTEQGSTDINTGVYLDKRMIPRPIGEFATEMLLTPDVVVEAYASNMRYDANIGGPVFFEELTLQPPRDRPGSPEVAAKPRQISDLYGFLDGDTDESAREARASRIQRVKMLGLEEESPEYQDKLKELEITERAIVLAEKVIPGESQNAIEAREQRKKIFEYIVGFWERSTIQLAVGVNTGGGLNLASRPFVAPTGPLENSPFQFNESYRWDTFFQNLGLNISGGSQIALDQLKNKIDVFALTGLIPNALTLSFTSHGQPPLEAIEAQNLLAKIGPGDWYGKAMTTIEQDLWNNWLDAGSGVKTQRQVLAGELGAIFQPNNLLTRHTNIHFSRELVGCEDGKDHYEITHAYGVNYLPVQLNAILHGHLETLQDYYSNYVEYNPNATQEDIERAASKANEYAELVIKHREQFQEIFWEGDDPDWKGFRNYALPGNGFDGQEGRIKFDDLSSEVFPLAFGLATVEQAQIIRDNIMNYYAGDQGLSSTNPTTRMGGVNFERYAAEFDKFQWRAPNCWPPLMEMATKGLKRYGFVDDANDLIIRWVRKQERNFFDTGYFHEKSVFDSKYNDVNPGIYGKITGGYGWTIGVYLNSLNKLATGG